MLSNNDTLTDEDGDTPDWLEIYNAGDTALDLAGWHLTDDASELEKWTFPDVSVEPGDFLLVFASGKDRTDADGSELHTNFKLSSGGEYLALVESGGENIAFDYDPTVPESETDVSYGISMDSLSTTLVDNTTPLTYLIPTSGQLGTTWTNPSFNDNSWNGASGPTLTAGIGYENSDAEYEPFIETRIPSGTVSFYSRFEFEISDPSQIDGLNLGVIYDDGFVAYLNGVRAASSEGAPDNPQWNSTNSVQRSDETVIEDFVRFDISQNQSALLAGTNVLAIQGLNRNSSSSDLLLIPDLQATTVSLSSQLEFGFFSEPTPGSGNGQSFNGFVADTEFSVDRGFYVDPISVAITTETPDATIVYTLDGSEPTADDSLRITNGLRYTGEIDISETSVLRAAAFREGFEPTNTDTQTYIFTTDVINQTEQWTLDQGFPSSWNGTAPDYGINVPAGHEADFIDALQGVPTLSISLPVDDLFGSDGIYSNPTSRGRAWERAASVELIYPDGTDGFQENAGLRIQGGAFRSPGLTNKNSLRLAFRGEYGASKLDFPILGPDSPDSFDNLNLRQEANDGWQWAAGEEKLFARDEFARRTQIATGQPASRGTRMHVYLNGVYWGLYNPVERPDEGFAENAYGGDKDDYDVIKSGELQEGTITAWNTLVSLSNQISASNNEETREALYQRILGNNPDGTPNANFPVYLDAENYVDYLITNWYGGNADWPFKNYAMVRSRLPDSEGFKFITWDAEWSLGLRSSVTTNRLNDTRGIAEPYGGLRDSVEFRRLFADRVHKHFFNDGALTTENVLERFDEIIAEVEPGLWGESGRWGDQHTGRFDVKTPDDDWIGEVNRIRTSYLPVRGANVIDQFVEADLYDCNERFCLAVPTWNQRGGSIPAGFGIELSGNRGQIYYTTDGSDPRLIGGAISPSARLYLGPITVDDPTLIRVRARDGSDWTPIDEAQFEPTAQSDLEIGLRISELHFHPAAPDASDVQAGFDDQDMFEFIELTNVSSSRILFLDGVTFDDGVEATFPENSFLLPGTHALVVSNLAAFTHRYGSDVVDRAATVIEFTGRLSNGGEQIRVVDSFGRTLADFEYQDGDDEGEESWHVNADGDGASLIVVNTEADYSDGTTWVSSSVPHGSPGISQADVLAGDYDRDGDVDDSDRFFWRDNFNATDGNGLFADGNVDGVVDAADFTIWRDNEGATRSLATAAMAARRQPRAATPAMVVTIEESMAIVESPLESSPSEPLESLAIEEEPQEELDFVFFSPSTFDSPKNAFESPKNQLRDLIFEDLGDEEEE